MTSSPGPIPSASTHVFKAWVPEPVLTHAFAPSMVAKSFSKVGTVPFGDCILHQIRLLVVFTIASTIFSSTYGHSGPILRGITGVPSRIASLPALLLNELILPNAGTEPETTAATEPADTVFMNRLLLNSFGFISIGFN